MIPTYPEKSLILFINSKEQSLLHRVSPGTHNALTFSANANQMRTLEQSSLFHISKGPIFNHGESGFYAFYKTSAEQVLQLVMSVLNMEQGLIKSASLSSIAQQLKNTKTLDANFYTLFYYYLNQQKEHLYLYEIHINFVFQYFKTDYFNQWYTDNVDFFESLGMDFSFVTQEPPQVTITGKTFCSKSTIEDAVIKLKDLGKHYSQRIWCTQIIDSIESIEDFSSL